MTTPESHDYPCPRCQAQLRTVLYLGVEMETCPVCEGEWLDADELREIVRQVERGFSPEEMRELEEARQRVFRLSSSAPSQLVCPKCRYPNRKLRPFRYAGTSQLVLDKCPGCGGIWLDKDELETVRALVDEWNGYLYEAQRAGSVAARKARGPDAPGADESKRSRSGFVMGILRAFR